MGYLAADSDFCADALYGAVLIGLGTQLKALDALPAYGWPCSANGKNRRSHGFAVGYHYAFGCCQWRSGCFTTLSHLSLSPSLSVSENLQFRTVKSMPELQNALADADDGRPVMLDFYAIGVCRVKNLNVLPER